MKKNKAISLILSLILLVSLFTTQQFISASDEVRLEDLTPLAQRTYNRLADSDLDTYGYGGPALSNWERGDLSNTGETFNSGLKLETTGSWTVSRFAVDYYVNRKYSHFSGQFVLHEKAKNETDSYYITILGDGKELYSSAIMTSGTLPQAFDVDISSVTTLTIQAKGTKDGAFSSYQYLGIVNALLSTGSGTTPSLPSTGSTDTVSLPSSYDILIEEMPTLASRTYDRLEDPDKEAYGYGGPAISTWEKGDLSNTGESFTSGAKVSTTGSWSLERFCTDYFLDQQYKSFSGKFVIHEDEKNENVQYYISILGDGKTLYTTDLMKNGTLAQSFSVDVTNVTVLTIQAKLANDSPIDFSNYSGFGIVDSGFVKSPTAPSRPAATGKALYLEDLTPFSLRTYNSLSDSDGEPYGYGGPSVSTWEKNDYSNTNQTFDHGIKLSTTGSWTISRFAADYQLSKSQSRFAGTILIHEEAKNNPDGYYVKILGDGRVLYSTNLMLPGSLPENFDIDVSGVNVLTIEAKGEEDDAFYNFRSIGIVNAGFGTAASTPISSSITLKGESLSLGNKLSWSSSDSSYGYRVYRSEVSGIQGISVSDFPITGTDYVDSNVKANTTYYYIVRSVLEEAKPFEGKSEVLGSASNEIMIKTPSTILVGDTYQAGKPKQFILMTLNSPYMIINGSKYEIDPGRGTVPQLINSRTLIPIRSLVEAMGGSVGWDPNSSTVTLEYEDKNIQMPLNSDRIWVNNVAKSIDVPAKSINGRTMVPIRFVIENFGCAIEWIGSTQQIVIVYQ